MKSLWTLVAAGLTTLALFSCAVPPAPPPPPVPEAPPRIEPVAEAPKAVEPVRTLPPAGPPEERILRFRDREKAMQVLREEERRNPHLLYELVEFGQMTRVGPQFRLIAKQKASSAAAKTD